MQRSGSCNKKANQGSLFGSQLTGCACQCRALCWREVWSRQDRTIDDDWMESVSQAPLGSVSFLQWMTLFNKLLECPVESWRESASDKIDS